MWKKVLVLFFIIVLTSLKAQASTENDDVSFAPYMKELQLTARKGWVPPLIINNSKVVIIFRIEKSGLISQSRIFESSGNKLIDDSALETIKRISPYKPLPIEFKGKSIDVKLTFTSTLISGYSDPLIGFSVKPLISKDIYKKWSREDKKNYNQYSNLVKKNLKANIPLDSYREIKVVKINFTVQANGVIKDVIITKYSDCPLYNELVENSIKSTKLPNIPKELGIKELKFKYRIDSGICVEPTTPISIPPYVYR